MTEQGDIAEALRALTEEFVALRRRIDAHDRRMKRRDQALVTATVAEVLVQLDVVRSQPNGLCPCCGTKHGDNGQWNQT